MYAPTSPKVGPLGGFVSETKCFTVLPFSRVTVRPPMAPNNRKARRDNGKLHPLTRLCLACMHVRGSCPLKVAGKEFCPLCGLAHYGHGRSCPHIKSETQVNAMISVLKQSFESKQLVDAAIKYLRGVKSTLVQQKERKKEIESKEATKANANGVNDVG